MSITGIYRAGSIRLNFNRRNVKSVYRTHIDAIHFNKGNTKGVKRQEEGSAFTLTADREAEIREIATRPDIYDTLAESLAPSIFGNEDIKKGILLQLIGASEKVNLIIGKNTQFLKRTWINLGVGKFAPRFMFYFVVIRVHLNHSSYQP